MRPQELLVALSVVAVLAALPLGKGGEEGGGGAAAAAPGGDAGARAWPCCDTCGLCTRSIPPICSCRDMSPGGCHPACRNCRQSTTGSGIGSGAPLFQCMDFTTNFCERRCTPAAAGAVVLGRSAEYLLEMQRTAKEGNKL